MFDRRSREGVGPIRARPGGAKVAKPHTQTTEREPESVADQDATHRVVDPLVEQVLEAVHVVTPEEQASRSGAQAGDLSP